jgi:Ring finger domain/CCCH-type zinc finger/RNA-binding, Nab2-type zinc finger
VIPVKTKPRTRPHRTVVPAAICHRRLPVYGLYRTLNMNHHPPAKTVSDEEASTPVSSLTTLGSSRSSVSAVSKGQDKPLCRFFVLHKGNCRYGAKCAYSHEIPDSLSLEDAKRFVPCPYFARGACRYGNRCQLMHTNPPTDSDAKQQARDISEADTAVEREELHTCGICLEDNPKRQFGLLSCCNHAFCFECLMEWRKEGSREVSGRRSCPTCRKHSDYVIPSKFFPKDEQDKQEIVQNYKNRMAPIPCKRFRKTMKLGSCPFGSECFYAHIDESGQNVKSQDKSMKTIAAERHRQYNQSRRWNRGFSIQSFEESEDDDADILLDFLQLLDLYGYPEVRNMDLSEVDSLAGFEQHQDDQDEDETHSSDYARHIRENFLEIMTVDFAGLDELDETWTL